MDLQGARKVAYNYLPPDAVGPQGDRSLRHWGTWESFEEESYAVMISSMLNQELSAQKSELAGDPHAALMAMTQAMTDAANVMCFMANMQKPVYL